MCNCQENQENFKEKVNLKVENNKNTNITFYINCNDEKKKSSTTPNNLNSITIKEAIDWTKTWRDSNYAEHHKCKAFNIPKEDLIEVLREDGVESIRAYMGIKTTTNKEGKLTYEEKLIIVGVNEFNKDIISSTSSNNKIAPDGFPEASGVYDFSEPCPNLCDPDSPLNDGI